MYCAYKNCSNSRSCNVSFFRFPKQVELKKVWQEFYGVSEDFYPGASTRLCSLHFNTYDLYVKKRNRNHQESETGPNAAGEQIGVKIPCTHVNVEELRASNISCQTTLNGPNIATRDVEILKTQLFNSQQENLNLKRKLDKLLDP